MPLSRTAPPRDDVVQDLVVRARKRLDALSPAARTALLEDALYTERKRLERSKAKPGERELLDQLASSLVSGASDASTDAAGALITAWAAEVHGHFDPRVYRFATRLLPRVLTALLSRRSPNPRRWDLAPDRRLKIHGDTAFLRELASEATLVLVPTHLSNLDSPIIGLALHLAGLPPVVYGAGLNLFSNPIMGWFMSRLGAYTVDRTKKSMLYKDVLKDYSVRCLTTGRHSLFFPGGTRSRSGAIERGLKKGLMGTGIEAWQEMLEAGRPKPDVYFVPLTLTSQLVLEANTLITDHLEEAGKQRFIITDDESADARRILHFARRILELDSAAVAHFGAPIDVLGQPVARDIAEREAQSQTRRGYVCDRDGRVERDPQRDRIYTNRLAHAIGDAYPRGHHMMANHVAAHVAWKLLAEREGTSDPFRLVRAGEDARQLPRAVFLERLGQTLERVQAGAAVGRFVSNLSTDPTQVLTEALDRFQRYHRTSALTARGDQIVVTDAKLTLYYSNRLDHPALEV